jgi:hypothetical protein
MMSRSASRRWSSVMPVPDFNRALSAHISIVLTGGAVTLNRYAFGALAALSEPLLP